jgi:Flp pilus assembly protein TadD
LDIDSNNINSQRALGLLQYQLGNYEASLCSFQKAFDLKPDDLILSSSLGYLHLLQGNVAKARKLMEEVAIQGKPFDRVWLNLGLIQAQQGQIDEAKQSWHQGLNLMEYDGDWSKAVHCVFTVALGNPAEGLEQMQNLVNSSLDKDALKNALNDATILSRTPQPLEGIEQMIQLLQEALLQL